MSQKILYISRAGLPMNASGIRTFYIGNLLESLGYSIHYISTQRITTKELQSDYQRICAKEFPFWAESEIHFKIGQKVYSYPSAFQGGKIGVVKEILELAYAKAAFARVCAYCDKERPHAIILYNDTYALTKRLIPYCKEKHIKLIADVTEWYEKDKNKNIAERLIVRNTEKRITKLDHKLDGIIAISHFLEDFYKNQRAKCVRIPPLMEISLDLKIQRHNKEVLKFVYAGSPGGKDILLPFVRAVQAINKENLKVRLDIVGMDGSYFNKYADIDPALEKTGVFAHGRRSHEETLEIVKNADFGILFRHNLRYAKAGFSTKLAECMSVGVPMICNQIGGTDTVIQNMKNGILTQTADDRELYNLLLQMIEWSDDAIIQMKQNAYAYAKKYFNGDMYINELQKFL